MSVGSTHAAYCKRSMGRRAPSRDKGGVALHTGTCAGSGQERRSALPMEQVSASDSMRMHGPMNDATSEAASSTGSTLRRTPTQMRREAVRQEEGTKGEGRKEAKQGVRGQEAWEHPACKISVRSTHTCRDGRRATSRSRQGLCEWRHTAARTVSTGPQCCPATRTASERCTETSAAAQCCRWA